MVELESLKEEVLKQMASMFSINLIFSFYYNRKKKLKIVSKDNNEIKKYLKYKKLLDLIVAVCFIALGAVSILKLYNGDLIVVFSSIILLLDKVIEFRINKRFQIIN